jgi:DNA-binding transcriptional LysR family regulator
MGINIARLDLVSIRLVVLCAELGSLSAAARRAHCSVSAASQRLSAIEKAVGATLFTRDHKGLRLTESGHLFVQHACVILRHLELLGKQVGTAA